MRTKLEIPKSAFPLAWPPGVSRTEKRKRESARFHGTTVQTVQSTDAQGAPRTSVYKLSRVLSVAESRDDTIAELQRLAARPPVVISTNLRTRNDGLPMSNQRDPEDPGVAVYFMLNRLETCIAIDRFDRVADNLRAVAKTIEAMRGIERWGGASLVAAAFTGFQGLPGPGVIVPPVAWHEVLGVPAHAPTVDVEARGRQLSVELHPDKGGDAAKFAAVREAIEAFRRERGIGSAA